MLAPPMKKTIADAAARGQLASRLAALEPTATARLSHPSFMMGAQCCTSDTKE